MEREERWQVEWQDMNSEEKLNMESINFYKCSKCGALYDENSKGEEMCKKCEKSHVGIVGLTGEVRYDRNNTYAKNCPTEIEVEMEDGYKVWYRKEK